MVSLVALTGLNLLDYLDRQIPPAAMVKFELIRMENVSSSIFTTTRTRAATDPAVGLCTATVTVWPVTPDVDAWRSE
jgi:hypothetical protein